MEVFLREVFCKIMNKLCKLHELVEKFKQFPRGKEKTRNAVFLCTNDNTQNMYDVNVLINRLLIEF